MYWSQIDTYAPKLGPYNAIALGIASELAEFCCLGHAGSLAAFLGLQVGRYGRPSRPSPPYCRTLRNDGRLYLPWKRGASSSKNSVNSEAIPNAIALYEPSLGSYISLQLEYIDSHTNFYEKRCIASKILYKSQKLEASIRICMVWGHGNTTPHIN